MFGSPTRQSWQLPQPLWKGVSTRIPGRMCSTSSPTVSTVPAHSCPSTTGSGSSNPTHERSPCQRCQSERHTPHASTRTSASFGPITGSSNSRTTRGWRTPSITTAFIVGSLSRISALSILTRIYQISGYPESDRPTPAYSRRKLRQRHAHRHLVRAQALAELDPWTRHARSGAAPIEPALDLLFNRLACRDAAIDRQRDHIAA